MYTLDKDGLHAVAQDGALFGQPGSDSWFEWRDAPEDTCTLMLRVPTALPSGIAPFHVALCDDTGKRLGWLGFRYVTTIRGAAVFAANEWRLADAQDPPAEGSVWPRLAPSPTNS